MNNEMLDRLRRFGDTVDQAAVAAGAPAGSLRDVSDPLAGVDALTEDVDDLELVVPLRGRRERRYQAIVAAAAALIVIGGVIVTARITGSPDSGAADSTDVIGSNPTTTEPNVMASTTAAVVVPVLPPESTSTSTTSTSSSTTTTPPPYTPVCPTYRANTTLPIRLCDKGAAVLVIQQHLGVVDADGFFGPSTRDAVRQFQRDHGLEVDGLVGQDTWSLLVPDAGVPGT